MEVVEEERKEKQKREQPKIVSEQIRVQEKEEPKQIFEPKKIEEPQKSIKKAKTKSEGIKMTPEMEKAVEKKCPEPVAIRGGGIFGIHKVYAMSDNEVICFEHSALNRKLFAEGAVFAALWISKKAKGLYRMQDMI